MTTERTPILRIRKREPNFFGHIRKECLENLVLTRHSESNKGSERQQATYLTSLHEWVMEQGSLTSEKKLLRVTQDKVAESKGQLYPEGIKHTEFFLSKTDNIT